MCWSFTLKCSHTCLRCHLICRPDHNLQDIRAKIFPLKRRKIDAPEITPEVTPEVTHEVTPSISLPVKRKERSLSSLVVSTPKVPMQTGLTGRRSRALTRKAAALRGCSFSAEEPMKRDDSTEDHPMSSSSTESLDRGARNKMQVKTGMILIICALC